MNEIEKAIEHFHYGITHDIFSEPVTTYARLAVEALREQAERSKGCSFCDEESGEHDYMNGLQSIDGTKYLVLETSEWDDYYDCYNDVRIPVKYCPMCGKRLEVEHE